MSPSEVEQWLDPGGAAQGKFPAIDSFARFTTYSVMAIVSDLTILSPPSIVVWRLQMKSGQKLLISSVFLLGAL